MAVPVTTITADELTWLRELASMLTPIVWPGEEVVHYEALARKGFAEKRWHNGWGNGWTATEAGRVRANAR